MRLLVVNANTSAQVTEIVARAARLHAAPGTEIVPLTGRFGARIINTRTENAIAEHALIDLLAEHGQGADGVLIGVSYDTGLAAARELMRVPVVGMTEAALHTACFLGARFGMLVFGRRAEESYRELVQRYGLVQRLATLHGIDANPSDMYRNPGMVESLVVEQAGRMIDEHNVDVILLSGAAMAEMPPKVQDRIAVPVINGVECGTRLVQTLAALKLPKARAGSYAALPAKELVGVAPAIAKLFRG
jgi:allantoin racemase